MKVVQQGISQLSVYSGEDEDDDDFEMFSLDKIYGTKTPTNALAEHKWLYVDVALEA